MIKTGHEERRGGGEEGRRMKDELKEVPKVKNEDLGWRMEADK